ncbi:MAG: hypothetical protein MN733_24300, partial [Nitrososphaera sp.]|nr:hypothetical protein [Nitrososphaera sp.]
CLKSGIFMYNPQNWLIGVGGAVIGFVVSEGINLYSLSKTLESSKKIAMVQLARDLTHDFYDGSSKAGGWRDVAKAIEQCDKLYEGYDTSAGRFSYGQINLYLGFFDDLGFYYYQGILDLSIIKQLFGAYIIEAYEYNEVRRYVEDLQGPAKQPRAFVHFLSLAKTLEEFPEYKDLTEKSRRGCSERG